MQTTPRINSDGRVMSDIEIQIFDLQTQFQKTDAAQKEELAALKKRVADLELKLEKAEQDKMRGPRFGAT